MEMVIGLSIVASLVAVNGFATRVVLRDADTERYQKVFQCAAVWLVPILGAIFVFALHRHPEKATGRYRESPDHQWDNVTSTREVGRSINTHAED